jgi:transposase
MVRYIKENFFVRYREFENLTHLNQLAEQWLREEADLKLPRFRRWCWREEEGEDPMPRTHQPYAAEYRRRIIELARAGRSINELAREFEPSANAIREWVKQAALDEGLRSDGLTTAEREELTRLRRENRMLREEREILAKAAAWFAQETATTPRRSHS